jgi:hypothetical protein
MRALEDILTRMIHERSAAIGVSGQEAPNRYE